MWLQHMVQKTSEQLQVDISLHCGGDKHMQTENEVLK